MFLYMDSQAKFLGIKIIFKHSADILQHMDVQVKKDLSNSEVKAMVSHLMTCFDWMLYFHKRGA